jgi:Cu/Ag efflux protein CusF
MRTILIAAVFMTSFAIHTYGKAAAVAIQTGTVTSVDARGKKFDCHGKNGDWTYRTTDKTLFLANRKKADFSALQAGANVEVRFHLVGKERVADQVTITAAPLMP